MGMRIQEKEESTFKVSVVGAGELGSAIAYTLLLKNLCNELALLDNDENNLNGELLDLKQGLAYQTNMKIMGSTDPSITQNSRVVILAAGARPQPGHSIYSSLDKNVEIYKDLVPKLAKVNPDTVFVVVSDPVEPLTYLTWKLSGFPFERVIGTGTDFVSQGFRYYLGEKLGIAPGSINAWVLGEHGDTPVPVWSSVSIAGVRLSELHPNFGKQNDSENWNECFNQVCQSCEKVIKCKGYSNWAPTISVVQICKAILHNEKTVYCVSTCAKHWSQSDKYGLNKEIFISLPCVLGKNGILSIVSQTLRDDEIESLKKCSEKLYNSQKNLKV